MTLQRSWSDLCRRLGVQPKQFGALLAVLVVAVGVLGAKFVLGPARAAAAIATPDAPAPAVAPATAATTRPETAKSVTKRTLSRTDLPQSCERDPFRLWMLPEPVVAPKAAASPAPSASTPGVLPGLALKAVVRGELAVFGDQTARVGDAVALPDGTFAEVVSIGDRAVTVVWDGRTLDVRLGGGTGTASRAPAAGGFK